MQSRVLTVNYFFDFDFFFFFGLPALAVAFGAFFTVFFAGFFAAVFFFLVGLSPPALPPPNAWSQFFQNSGVVPVRTIGPLIKKRLTAKHKI